MVVMRQGSAPRPWYRFGSWVWHAAAGVILAGLFVWDRPILCAIRDTASSRMHSLTSHVGNMRGIVLPIVVAGLLIAAGTLVSRPRLRRGGLALFVIAVLSGSSASVLKASFGRPGPSPDCTAPPGTFWQSSRDGRFPSSHAAIIYGSAAAVTSFWPVAGLVAYPVATLVAYERIYKATHFPSDVFAGAWLGTAIAQAVLGWLARRGRWSKILSTYAGLRVETET
jgi:membrane-associated phospholipid phosphatase